MSDTEGNGSECAACGCPLESVHYSGVPGMGSLCPSCHGSWQDTNGTRGKREASGRGEFHECVVAVECTGLCACGKAMSASHEDRIGALESEVYDLKQQIFALRENSGL